MNALQLLIGLPTEAQGTGGVRRGAIHLGPQLSGRLLQLIPGGAEALIQVLTRLIETPQSLSQRLAAPLARLLGFLNLLIQLHQLLPRRLLRLQLGAPGLLQLLESRNQLLPGHPELLPLMLGQPLQLLLQLLLQKRSLIPKLIEITAGGLHRRQRRPRAVLAAEALQAALELLAFRLQLSKAGAHPIDALLQATDRRGGLLLETLGLCAAALEALLQRRQRRLLRSEGYGLVALRGLQGLLQVLGEAIETLTQQHRLLQARWSSRVATIKHTLQWGRHQRNRPAGGAED